MNYLCLSLILFQVAADGQMQSVVRLTVLVRELLLAQPAEEQ